jgi:hypothetical protein
MTFLVKLIIYKVINCAFKNKVITGKLKKAGYHISMFYQIV